MIYYRVHSGRMEIESHVPAEGKSFVRAAEELLPPQITHLHEQFHAWGELGISPGPILPHRIWLGKQDELYFHFPAEDEPMPLSTIGIAPDLAAWLVLLDKWMETFVIIARARTIWTPLELAAALRFCSPAFLPPQLNATPPDNWARVAHALAVTIADQPLAGAPQDRHWEA